MTRRIGEMDSGHDVVGSDLQFAQCGGVADDNAGQFSVERRGGSPLKSRSVRDDDLGGRWRRLRAGDVPNPACEDIFHPAFDKAAQILLDNLDDLDVAELPTRCSYCNSVSGELAGAVDLLDCRLLVRLL